MSLHLALKAITINAAYILRREHEIGSIEVGKFADFGGVVGRPYLVNPARIAEEVEIRGTWLAGRPTEPDAFIAEAAALPVSLGPLTCPCHSVVCEDTLRAEDRPFHGYELTGSGRQRVHAVPGTGVGRYRSRGARDLPRTASRRRRRSRGSGGLESGWQP